MTLSTPVKVAALAGLALILGAGGLLMLASSRHHASSAASSAPPAAAVTVVRTSAPAHHAAAKPKLDADLPGPVRRALEHSRETVALVYSPRSAGDRALLREARAGARAAGVAFAALDVSREPVAEDVYAWTGSVADPSVLVVRRPGTVTFRLDGSTDRVAVAQAAAARR